MSGGDSTDMQHTGWVSPRFSAPHSIVERCSHCYLSGGDRHWPADAMLVQCLCRVFANVVGGLYQWSDNNKVIKNYLIAYLACSCGSRGGIVGLQHLVGCWVAKVARRVLVARVRQQDNI